VLKLERVGIHDNFFELGGDSILGIQICTRANSLGLRLTPTHLFEYQTIAEVSAMVSGARTRRSEDSPATQAQPQKIKGFTPADFPGARVTQEELDKLLSTFDQGKKAGG
jgi:hypothetical protein